MDSVNHSHCRNADGGHCIVIKSRPHNKSAVVVWVEVFNKSNTEQDPTVILEYQ